MSTNNFSFENILVVLPDFNYDYKKPCKCCEDENCEYAELDSEFDDLAYNEYIANVQSQLEKIGFESSKDEWERSYNRSGSIGRIIAKWGQEDNCFVKWLEVVVRSGYYGGMNIDYTIDGDFCPQDEQNKKEIKHIEALQKKFDKQVARLEKILRKNGTEMLKVGQFSNGEAVYKLK